MAMLAERRRKTKWVINPTRKPLWTTDAGDVKFGKELMEKMGWAPGKGLGLKEQGMQEPLKVSGKNNTKGFGFKGNEEDWIEHQDEFNSLLNQLTNSNDGSVVKLSEAEKNEIKSLEEKSKKSRARVHYQKFTRGKDLSRYSENDLACILGTNKAKKDKSSEEQVKEEIKDGYETSFGVTTINSGSIQDYFKKKFALSSNSNMKMNGKSQNECDNSEEESPCFKLNENGEEESKKRKLDNSGDKETQIVDSIDYEESAREAKKHKKKRNKDSEESEELPKKKKKKNYGSGEENEINEVPSEERSEGLLTEGENVRKKKKKGKRELDEEEEEKTETGPLNSGDVDFMNCDESVKEAKKHQKKKNKDPEESERSYKMNKQNDPHTETVTEENELQEMTIKDHSEGILNEENGSLKKKKKKSKRELDVEGEEKRETGQLENSGDVDSMNCDENVKEAKKHKKKNKDLEESEELPRKKKKGNDGHTEIVTKENETQEATSKEYSEGILNEEDENFKKKKKKSKREFRKDSEERRVEEEEISNCDKKKKKLEESSVQLLLSSKVEVQSNNSNLDGSTGEGKDLEEGATEPVKNKKKKKERRNKSDALDAEAEDERNSFSKGIETEISLEVTAEGSEPHQEVEAKKHKKKKKDRKVRDNELISEEARDNVTSCSLKNIETEISNCNSEIDAEGSEQKVKHKKKKKERKDKSEAPEEARDNEINSHSKDIGIDISNCNIETHAEDGHNHHEELEPVKHKKKKKERKDKSEAPEEARDNEINSYPKDMGIDISNCNIETHAEDGHNHQQELEPVKHKKKKKERKDKSDEVKDSESNCHSNNVEVEINNSNSEVTAEASEQQKEIELIKHNRRKKENKENHTIEMDVKEEPYEQEEEISHKKSKKHKKEKKTEEKNLQEVSDKISEPSTATQNTEDATNSQKQNNPAKHPTNGVIHSHKPEFFKKKLKELRGNYTNDNVMGLVFGADIERFKGSNLKNLLGYGVVNGTEKPRQSR